MPDERFRGDPYTELELRHDSTNTQIKRRWRELAREHHPDRAAGNREETTRLTARMARINAAYDLLRDPGRRAAYDSSAAGLRARAAEGTGADRVEFDDGVASDGRPGGPPPPPRYAAGHCPIRHDDSVPPAQCAVDPGEHAARPSAPSAPPAGGA